MIGNYWIVTVFELLENLLDEIEYITLNKADEAMLNETDYVIENRGGAKLCTPWYNAYLIVCNKW